jgi:hypothetical protein
MAIVLAGALWIALAAAPAGAANTREQNLRLYNGFDADFPSRPLSGLKTPKALIELWVRMASLQCGVRAYHQSRLAYPERPIKRWMPRFNVSLRRRIGNQGSARIADPKLAKDPAARALAAFVRIHATAAHAFVVGRMDALDYRSMSSALLHQAELAARDLYRRYKVPGNPFRAYLILRAKWTMGR